MREAIANIFMCLLNFLVMKEAEKGKEPSLLDDHVYRSY